MKQTEFEIVRRVEYAVGKAVESLPGARPLLVTVSGGCDSVSLLVALQRLGRKIVAAHCNFHLRGGESNRDQSFVEKLCHEYGIELKVIHFDVESYRKRHGVSMEMACRELRYEWFEELAGELDCSRILTAHHADDNVETMLLNMLRGCGVEGAKGMVPDTGKIMRPLLNLHRTELEEYLKVLHQNWIIDSTNLDSEPDRNFLRLEVLPLLQRRFPGAVRRLNRTRENLWEAFKVYDHWRHSEAVSNELPLKVYRDSPSPSTLLHEWLRNHGFSAAQEKEMLRESQRSQGKTRWWKSANTIVTLSPTAFQRLPLSPPSIYIYEALMEEKSDEIQKIIRSNRDNKIAYFPKPLCEYKVRSARPGDRLIISPHASKKVYDLLHEAGIPVPYRSEYPVLCDSLTDEPLWIPGVRRAAKEYIPPESSSCYKFFMEDQ